MTVKSKLDVNPITGEMKLTATCAQGGLRSLGSSDENVKVGCEMTSTAKPQANKGLWDYEWILRNTSDPDSIGPTWDNTLDRETITGELDFNFLTMHDFVSSMPLLTAGILDDFVKLADGRIGLLPGATADFLLNNGGPPLVGWAAVAYDSEASGQQLLLVPEPTSLSVIALGLISLMCIGRKRKLTKP